MIRTVRRLSLHDLAVCGFAAASLILAVEPLNWLAQTWRDPSYETSGWLYLAVLAALTLWSVSSLRKCGRKHEYFAAALLLGAAAFLRFVSQISAINILGGMALALDVFALLTWLGVRDRERSVSPLWMSALFLFTLPFERIAQRILGYPMQEASAFGACQLLTPFFSELICEGVRLKVAGQDVLVDLPCSGTASLMLSLAFVVALSAVAQPRLGHAALMLVLTLILSIVGNALRIWLLAIGIVYGPAVEIDVMAAPLHGVVGSLTMIVSLAPLVWFYRASPRSAESVPTFSWVPRCSARVLSCIAGGFVVMALLIVTLPRQAFDVSREVERLALPASLNGAFKQELPLSGLERTYFEHFGGTAQKASYGPMSMTVVQTTSPLRHLHAPDDCLRGLGYRVTFIGTRFAPVPTAIYKAVDRDGRAFKVAVTFISSTGFATSNIAEAIWHWLQSPAGEWQSVQRITPWTLNDRTRDRFELAAIAALDLTASL